MTEQELREALIEALRDQGLDPGAGLYADALLPVVVAYARESAAKELRDAGDGCCCSYDAKRCYFLAAALGESA